jgi:hypothetical protein
MLIARARWELELFFLLCAVVSAAGGGGEGRGGGGKSDGDRDDDGMRTTRRVRIDPGSSSRTRMRAGVRGCTGARKGG